MNTFSYVSYAQEVIFAAGSLSHLPEAVAHFGWQRLMLCTSPSLREKGLVDTLQAALGSSLVAIFERVQPHVQGEQVQEAVRLATERNVDALIGMGGGSPVGMAKAVASSVEEMRAAHPAHPAWAAYPTRQPLVPVIAIPTTYAGSEMTPVYGITHAGEHGPRKVTVNDPKITPKLVIYDPELTLGLPAALTASTGINALAHCIEALYSLKRNPLSTAAATEGVGHIARALLECYQHGNNLPARSEMLLGSHLAGLSLASVSMGLHHGLCHVLGGSANVPHGIANSIILPHAIRFNADATARELLPAVQAMGIPLDNEHPQEAVEALAQRIYQLIGQMDLPRRLRDVGVARADLPRLAEIAFQNHTVQNNPKAISTPLQLEQLLGTAW